MLRLMKSLSFKSTFSLVFAAAVVSGLGDGLIPIAFALQAHRVDPSGLDGGAYRTVGGPFP